MPGYVMHLAEADIVTRELQKQCELSGRWAEHFMTGNLLPDTRLRREKYISHFWNPEDAGLIAQAPDLNRFLRKYGAGMEEPLLLGYLMHLHLDAEYVHRFWPRCIAFVGEDGKPEARTDRIARVKLLKSGREVPKNDFFSPAVYYGDYGRMNAYFVRTYHIRAPRWQDIRDFHMDEVKLSDMERVCRDLDWLKAHCTADESADLQVFDLREFDDFIRECAGIFIRTYL